MNHLERMFYEPRGGMFREFVGINVFLKPRDRRLYQNLLPKPFVVPKQPVVVIFAVDYLKLAPWPLTRCQEAAVLLKSRWHDQEGWYVLTMPVTSRVQRMGGRYVGFPKYLVDAIAVARDDQGWRAESRYKGRVQLRMDFQPGATRPLLPWEAEQVSDEAFFRGEIHLLVPPGKGPQAQRARFNHVVPAHWSPEVGMVHLEADSGEPWAGLVPPGGPFPGTFNHFTGGINLVVER